MKPKISVCIPTYNGAEFLGECIDSILLQTFCDFELIIVDDQSSDRTLEIAQRYAFNDSRIKIFNNNQNLGLVGNWNRCIEVSEGEWIKFVFQDDTIEPTCLEKMWLATQLGKPIIYCRRNFIFEAGTDENIKEFYLNHLSVKNSLSDTVEISPQQYAELALQNIFVNFVGEPTSVMLHRNVFIQFGSFNPYLIMICDFEFYTRVAIHSGIVQIPEVLANFRVHSTAASAVSKVNREYRGWILDKLILVHDYAFHSAYFPIRTIAQQCYPTIDLVQLFKHQVLSAWEIAQSERYSTQACEFSAHLELEKVSKFYPLITRMIESNAQEQMKNRVFIKMKLFISNIKHKIVSIARTERKVL